MPILERYERCNRDIEQIQLNLTPHQAEELLRAIYCSSSERNASFNLDRAVINEIQYCLEKYYSKQPLFDEAIHVLQEINDQFQKSLLNNYFNPWQDPISDFPMRWAISSRLLEDRDVMEFIYRNIPCQVEFVPVDIGYRDMLNKLQEELFNFKPKQPVLKAGWFTEE